MRRLLDAVARRLGYVSGGTFADVTETYSRRILALGDELNQARASAGRMTGTIGLLRATVDRLKGMLAAADERRERDIASLVRQLAIQKSLRAAVDADLRKYTDAARAFRAATEDI